MGSVPVATVGSGAVSAGGFGLGGGVGLGEGAEEPGPAAGLVVVRGGDVLATWGVGEGLGACGVGGWAGGLGGVWASCGWGGGTGLPCWG